MCNIDNFNNDQMSSKLSKLSFLLQTKFQPTKSYFTRLIKNPLVKTIVTKKKSKFSCHTNSVHPFFIGKNAAGPDITPKPSPLSPFLCAISAQVGWKDYQRYI